MFFLIRYALLSLALMLLSSATLAGQTFEALDFELPMLDGQRFFRLSEVRGKTVLINFWDTECPPCIREMPLLDQAARAHPEAVFIGVTLSPKPQARNFLEGMGVSYLQLLAPTNARGLLRRFGNPVGALPHTVVLGSEHALCVVKTGEIDRRWIDAALRRCQRSDQRATIHDGVEQQTRGSKMSAGAKRDPDLV
jgi:thiol-disulfide isomerase/thioredoxin